MPRLAETVPQGLKPVDLLLLFMSELPTRSPRGSGQAGRVPLRPPTQKVHDALQKCGHDPDRNGTGVSCPYEEDRGRGAAVRIGRRAGPPTAGKQECPSTQLRTGPSTPLRTSPSTPRADPFRPGRNVGPEEDAGLKPGAT